MLQKKIVPHLVLTAVLAVMAAQAGKADEWSGIYAGVGGGPQWDHSKWTANSVGPNNVFGVNAATATTKFDDGHGRLGGFIGWQCLISPEMLAGIEGDIYGIIKSDSSKAGLPGINYGSLAPDDKVTESHKYDASLRGRLGTFVEPNTLVYGTAGVAFRDLALKASCPGTANSWCGISETADQSKTLVGWTAGVGAESKLTSQLAVRLEYRYAGFGNTNIALFANSNQGADQTGNKIDLTSQIVTLGIVYHFGL